MSDSPFQPLTSSSDWTSALEQSQDTPVLVFKHSSACPVSGKADGEMAELAEEAEVPVYKVVVQQNRSVSDDIEADLDVRHETPQAILLHEETPVFDTSHFNVTAESLRRELRQVSSPTKQD
jgi:bacillithiol system protein YtxJ